MIGVLNGIKIQGMSAAVPKFVECNDAYEDILGKRRLKKQIRLTGVQQRRVARNRQHTADLCCAAANKLIRHLEWNKEDISILVLVTQSPTFCVPATSFFVQEKLGLSKNCVVFDVNLGCSSVDNGVQIVGSLLEKEEYGKKALLLVGDTSGTMLKPSCDYNADVIADRLLFGSGGAAVAMERVHNSKVYYQNESNGSGYEAIHSFLSAPMEMDGEKVFDFAINDVADSVDLFRKHFNLSEEMIDYYVFHQAQRLILDNLAMTLDIPEEKELRSIEEFGNTSGTSVIISVCHNVDKLKKNEETRLLMTGFGVGLSWGSVYALVPSNNILPIIETNEFDDLGKKERRKLFGRQVLILNADTEVGIYMARYLDDKSARLILHGNDQMKLDELKNSLFYDHTVVSNENEIEAAINMINYKSINGVLICHQTVEAYSSLIHSLQEKKLLKTDSAVLSLVRENEYNDSGKSPDICHCNTIVFDDSKLYFTDMSGTGQEWGEVVFDENKAEGARQAFVLAETTEFFLSDKVRYLDKTVLRIKQQKDD